MIFSNFCRYLIIDIHSLLDRALNKLSNASKPGEIPMNGWKVTAKIRKQQMLFWCAAPLQRRAVRGGAAIHNSVNGNHRPCEAGRCYIGRATEGGRNANKCVKTLFFENGFDIFSSKSIQLHFLSRIRLENTLEHA